MYIWINYNYTTFLRDVHQNHTNSSYKQLKLIKTATSYDTQAFYILFFWQSTVFKEKETS